MFFQKYKDYKQLKSFIKEKDCKSVEACLRAGTDPNYAPLFGDSPLLASLEQDNTHILACLLKHGANPNQRHAENAQDFITPLRKAMSLNKMDMVETLLKDPRTNIFQEDSQTIALGAIGGHPVSPAYFSLPSVYELAKTHENTECLQLFQKYRRDEIARYEQNTHYKQSKHKKPPAFKA